MLNEDEIQNDLLDRLVDGELPDGDYRTLIHHLDDSPDGWRRCALSFLEQQALQRDLKQMLKEGHRFDSFDDAPLEHDGEAYDSPRATTQDRWERWLGQPWVRWTSVLAVGILAFVGGLALQPFGSSARPTNEQLADASPKSSNSGSHPNALASNDSLRDGAETLFIENSSGGSSKPLPVQVRPVNYRDGSAIPKFAPEQNPTQFVNGIGGANGPIRIERRIYIMQTKDGSIFILPVDIFVQESPFQ